MAAEVVLLLVVPVFARGGAVVFVAGPRVMTMRRCAHSCKWSVVPITAGRAKDKLLLVLLVPIPGIAAMQHQSIMSSK